MSGTAQSECLCGRSELDVVFTYTEPPAGEVRFDFGAGKTYLRRVMRCRSCGHFLSVHDMDMSNLYKQDYVDSTYRDGVQRAFERILGLDPARSDNVGRVRRVVEFVERRGPAGSRTVLDVGSGLCVFLHRLKQETGWDCTALDPDPRAAAHARERAAVNSVCGDFMEMTALSSYDLITFNKVLEHVLDPVAMLARARRHLSDQGLVYIELPDGEAAVEAGPGREEFFIDHHHIFSAQSLLILAQRAGFRLLELERLREPSTKYTLRAFLLPGGQPPSRQ
jgi:SAM-dependent methyltransferase